MTATRVPDVPSLAREVVVVSPETAAASNGWENHVRPLVPPVDSLAVPASALEAYHHAARRTLTGPELRHCLKDSTTATLAPTDLARIAEASVRRLDECAGVSRTRDQVILVATEHRKLIGAYNVPVNTRTNGDDGSTYYAHDAPLNVILGLGLLLSIDEQVSDCVDVYICFWWNDRNPPALNRCEMDLLLQIDTLLLAAPNSRQFFVGAIGISRLGDDIRHYDFVEDLCSWSLETTQCAVGHLREGFDCAGVPREDR